MFKDKCDICKSKINLTEIKIRRLDNKIVHICDSCSQDIQTANMREAIERLKDFGFNFPFSSSVEIIDLRDKNKKNKKNKKEIDANDLELNPNGDS